MGKNILPDSPKERRVLEDALFFHEYGLPFDPRKELSQWEFQAHLAIIEGRNKERKKQSKKAKKGT